MGLKIFRKLELKENKFIFFGFWFFFFVINSFLTILGQATGKIKVRFDAK